MSHWTSHWTSWEMKWKRQSPASYHWSISNRTEENYSSLELTPIHHNQYSAVELHGSQISSFCFSPWLLYHPLCISRVILTHADDDCNSWRMRNRWVGKACLSWEGQSIPVSLTNELYFRPAFCSGVSKVGEEIGGTHKPHPHPARTNTHVLSHTNRQIEIRILSFIHSLKK